MEQAMDRTYRSGKERESQSRERKRKTVGRGAAGIAVIVSIAVALVGGWAMGQNGLAPITVTEHGSDVNGVSSPDVDFPSPPALFITETGASACTNLASPLNYQPTTLPYTVSVYLSALGISCSGSQISQAFTFETPPSMVAESPTFYFSTTFTNNTVTTTASWTVSLTIPAQSFNSYNSDFNVYLEFGQTLVNGGIQEISVVVT